MFLSVLLVLTHSFDQSSDFQSFSSEHMSIVLITSFLTFLIGIIWFSPKVFGSDWISGLGKTPEEIKRDAEQTGMVIIFGLDLIVSLLKSVFINWGIYKSETTNEFMMFPTFALFFMLSIYIHNVCFARRNMLSVRVEFSYQLTTIALTSMLTFVYHSRYGKRIH